MRPNPTQMVRGVAVFQGFLEKQQQTDLVSVLRDVVSVAPLFSPQTRFGQKMSVQMTSTGRFGWYSDRGGYRYVETHPITGQPWPDIPQSALDIWRAMTGVDRDPESCLINVYKGNARMGLHQDKDEADLAMPVVSVSLGDDALFRIGNVERGGKTESIWLRSGDVAVIGGSARLVHHGIDRIAPDTSGLLAGGGRINLTMRVVT